MLLTSLSALTSPLLESSRGQLSARVVILAEKEPSADVRVLLAHPHLQGRMSFLQGSIDIPHDLERCRADCADAVFLLADKMPLLEGEQHRQDLRTIAQVLTLKAFNPSLQLFVQLLRPENKAFLNAMPDWSPVTSAAERGDQVICVTEMASALRLP